MLLLISLLSLAQVTDGFTIPASAVITGFGVMAGAVAYMFRVVVTSYEKRLSEQTVSQENRVASIVQVNEKMASEMEEMWNAINRGNYIRALEISAAPHIAPELREEAANMVREIKEKGAKK